MKYLIILALLSLTACDGNANTSQTSNQPNPNTQNITQTETKTMTNQAKSIELSINGKTFTAELADTAAAQDFVSRLPLTLTMQDHLANEKFATLDTPLSQDDKQAGQIHAGDIMLWQGDTVVVFYKSLHSNYSYTRLGKIQDDGTLADTVGRGDVVVSFKITN